MQDRYGCLNFAFVFTVSVNTLLPKISPLYPGFSPNPDLQSLTAASILSIMLSTYERRVQLELICSFHQTQRCSISVETTHVMISSTRKQHDHLPTLIILSIDRNRARPLIAHQSQVPPILQRHRILLFSASFAYLLKFPLPWFRAFRINLESSIQPPSISRRKLFNFPPLCFFGKVWQKIVVTLEFPKDSYHSDQQLRN